MIEKEDDPQIYIVWSLTQVMLNTNNGVKVVR